MLRGRSAERVQLDRLLESIHAGQSAVLVLRGEAGIGKTALLEYTAERAEGCRVLRAVGVESEMELPFAGLHQLFAPLLEGLERLRGDSIKPLRVIDEADQWLFLGHLGQQAEYGQPDEEAVRRLPRP